MSNGHDIFRFVIFDRQSDAQLPTEVRVGPNFMSQKDTKLHKRSNPRSILRVLSYRSWLNGNTTEIR
jgi:hypothetical protein